MNYLKIELMNCLKRKIFHSKSEIERVVQRIVWVAELLLLFYYKISNILLKNLFSEINNYQINQKLLNYLTIGTRLDFCPVD